VADQITTRRSHLLDEIRRTGGRYTTGQAHAFYQATGYGPCRTTARKDLQWWTRQGFLQQHGLEDGRFYTLANRKGGTA
jgi:hypothetical protein